MIDFKESENLKFLSNCLKDTNLNATSVAELSFDIVKPQPHLRRQTNDPHKISCDWFKLYFASLMGKHNLFSNLNSFTFSNFFFSSMDLQQLTNLITQTWKTTQQFITISLYDCVYLANPHSRYHYDIRRQLENEIFFISNPLVSFEHIKHVGFEQISHELSHKANACFQPSCLKCIIDYWNHDISNLCKHFTGEDHFNTLQDPHYDSRICAAQPILNKNALELSIMYEYLRGNYQDNITLPSLLSSLIENTKLPKRVADCSQQTKNPKRKKT